MKTATDFLDAIGNTPMIRLRGPSAATGCEILGKAEFMNPGGSVKDRAARAIVLDAERRGALQPGGTVVEGTAGNTGIGLAHVCNARGYRCVIVMPDNQSPEKYELIAALGAAVIASRPPPRDPNHTASLSHRDFAQGSGQPGDSSRPANTLRPRPRSGADGGHRRPSERHWRTPVECPRSRNAKSVPGWLRSSGSPREYIRSAPQGHRATVTGASASALTANMQDAPG
jgi:hypothetical protein